MAFGVWADRCHFWHESLSVTLYLFYFRSIIELNCKGSCHTISLASIPSMYQRQRLSNKSTTQYFHTIEIHFFCFSNIKMSVNDLLVLPPQTNSLLFWFGSFPIRITNTIIFLFRFRNKHSIKNTYFWQPQIHRTAVLWSNRQKVNHRKTWLGHIESKCLVRVYSVVISCSFVLFLFYYCTLEYIIFYWLFPFNVGHREVWRKYIFQLNHNQNF